MCWSASSRRIAATASTSPPPTSRRAKFVHVHRKVYLPTYGLFDEGRFFAWGDQVRAFDTRFGRCGMLICEDFWHASPPYLLWLDGADLLFFALGLARARA